MHRAVDSTALGHTSNTLLARVNQHHVLSCQCLTVPKTSSCAFFGGYGAERACTCETRDWCAGMVYSDRFMRRSQTRTLWSSLPDASW